MKLTRAAVAATLSVALLVLISPPASAQEASETCIESATIYALGQPVVPAQKRCIPWY